MVNRVLFTAAVLLVTCSAEAQVPLLCGGTITITNTSIAFGTNGWLLYTLNTSVPPNICTTRMHVDAFVMGVPGSALHREGFYTASAQRQIPVPYSGRWITNGIHGYQLAIPPGVVFNAGLTSSYVDITIRTAAEDCAALGFDYYWNGSACDYTPGSPIIVDTSGEGYRLTGLRDGVVFDLDADGRPERVSWTAAGAENAFLAIDSNQNGRIDSGAELIGSYTPVIETGDSQATAANGFEVLKFLEAIGSTSLSDDQIDRKDQVFRQLLLWTDRNHNGFSESDELMPLEAAGIRSLELNYKTSSRRDRWGNEFRQVAKLHWADGSTSRVYDIWLKVR
jgi:hypothetical protein